MKIILTIAISLISALVYSQDAPTLETYSLKNGVKIYLLQYGKIPAVNVRFVINTGEKNESPGQQGYCGITASMLLKGNSKYTEQQQNDSAFKIGCDMNAADTKDHTTISANCLTKDFDRAMDLFSSAILHPSFNKDKLDQEISQMIDFNSPAKMDVANLADMYNDLFIYGTASPFGRNNYRTQLQQVTTDKIKEFHAFNYTPKNASIVVCGNFNSQEIKKVVEKYFGEWQSTYGDVNSVSLDLPQIKKKEIGFINRNSATQCALQWCKTAPSLKDKDLLAFSVANRIFNVFLFSEIREKGGKTYSIGCAHRPSQFSNTMEIGCSVRNDEMLNTINLFDKSLQTFSQGNITQEEFDKAVLGIKINVMSSELPAEISSIYNPIIYDFNKRKNFLNDLAALKLEDVQKVIKKHFTADAYKLMIAGDESVVGNQLNSIKGLTKFKTTDIEKDN
jgi:predicted Zn-dependent peptidase